MVDAFRYSLGYASEGKTLSETNYIEDRVSNLEADNRILAGRVNKIDSRTIALGSRIDAIGDRLNAIENAGSRTSGKTAALSEAMMKQLEAAGKSYEITIDNGAVLIRVKNGEGAVVGEIVPDGLGSHDVTLREPEPEVEKIDPRKRPLEWMWLSEKGDSFGYSHSYVRELYRRLCIMNDETILNIGEELGWTDDRGHKNIGSSIYANHANCIIGWAFATGSVVKLGDAVEKHR